MSSGMNLFITRLDKRVTDRILRQEFEHFGELLLAETAKDEEGNSRGYGFVHFVSMADGIRALQQMNEKAIMSKKILVQMAKNQDDRKLGKDVNNRTQWASDWDFLHNQDSSSDSSSVISSATNYENQEVPNSATMRLKVLFETQQYADVTFYPKNDRSTSISAHKAILAIASPLFQKMLFGENDDCSPGAKLEVEISNLSFTAFSNIIKYIYTDEVFFENDSLVVDILDGAVQFGIHPLADRCKAYFQSVVLTNQNVFSKLQMSYDKKIDGLKDRCLDYIQENTLEALKSADFMNCAQNTVRTICKLQSLNLHNETELLEAMMKWLDFQNSQKKAMFSDQLRKCIRFLTFSAKEFGNVLRKYPEIMSSNDALKIMLYLNNPPSTPDFKSLPSWCNKSTMDRCVYKENKTDDSPKDEEDSTESVNGNYEQTDNEESDAECCTTKCGGDDIEILAVGPLMNKLFELQMYTDITLYSATSKENSISAHRAVLAAKSKYFANLFVAENGNKHNTHIKISNIKFNAFQNIITYIYTDEIHFETDESVFEIYSGAIALKLPILADLCETQIESIILSEENACKLLQLSLQNNIRSLKNKCISYIEENTLKIVW